MRTIPDSGYIYLASPYSHPDPIVREARYLAAMREVAGCLRENITIYSPIVHYHELAKITDLPKEVEFWETYNYIMLRAAEMLWVLMLDGWEKSKGIEKEMAKAREFKIPVIQLNPKKGVYV